MPQQYKSKRYHRPTYRRSVHMHSLDDKIVIDGGGVCLSIDVVVDPTAVPSWEG